MDNDLEIKNKDFESLKIKARENEPIRKFLDEDKLTDNTAIHSFVLNDNTVSFALEEIHTQNKTLLELLDESEHSQLDKEDYLRLVELLDVKTQEINSLLRDWRD